jgi:hypothetical protein
MASELRTGRSGIPFARLGFRPQGGPSEIGQNLADGAIGLLGDGLGGGQDVVVDGEGGAHRMSRGRTKHQASDVSKKYGRPGAATESAGTHGRDTGVPT